MTPTDPTTPSTQQTLAIELDLRHPPEKVWRALTDPELLSEWLLPVIGLRLEPGVAFSDRTQPQPGWDGIVNCRMLAIDSPRRLSYTWTALELETVVTFTLTPTTEGTRLSVVQSGFAMDQKREFGGARYGWTMMTGRLVALLDRISQP